MSIKRTLRLQRGITLLETIMFMVIVGIALGGIVQVFSLSAKFSADPLRRKQALAIAESLLEEVELAGFTYCDPADTQAAAAIIAAQGVAGVGCTTNALVEKAGREAGNTRPYDNVNDYIGTGYGMTDATAFNNAGGALADANLASIAAVGYTASLKITPTDTLNNIVSTANPLTTNVLRITVTVTDTSNNSSVTLDGYRTRYSPNP